MLAYQKLDTLDWLIESKILAEIQGFLLNRLQLNNSLITRFSKNTPDHARLSGARDELIMAIKQIKHLRECNE